MRPDRSCRAPGAPRGNGSCTRFPPTLFQERGMPAFGKVPGARDRSAHGRFPVLLACAAACMAAAASLEAQTIDDSVMMPRGALCTGFLYTHDSWDEYWEGTLERRNGNI